VQALHLVAERVQVSVVRDHIIRGREPRGARGLSPENGAGLLERGAVARLKAADLQRLVAVDHEDSIDGRGAAQLDEQWQDEDLISAAHPSSLSLHRPENGWMRQCLEIGACSGVGENEIAESPPVEASVGADIALAEARDDLSQKWSADRRDLPRDHIGVDDGHPESGEQARDRGFAAGDAAGEADAEWMCSVVRHAAQLTRVNRSRDQ